MASIEHYLPQFLLRGFAARVDRGRHHVYVFRRGSTPRLANVRDVAGERGFYGAVNAVAVEPALAEKETAYGGLVKQLRTSGATAGDKPMIDAFVLHILGRGQHLRESSMETAEMAIETTAAGLRAREDQEALLLSGLDESNPEFRALMARVPRAKRGAMRKQLEHLARQDVRRGGIDAMLPTELGRLRETLDVPEAARRAQGNAILREPPGSQARPVLAGLSWDVRRSQTHTYILGDVGVVAFSSQTGLSNPLKSGAGDLQALFLPIASSVLLIGMTDGAPIVSDDEINMASSKLSRHVFIASSDGPEQAAYLPFLGEQSAVVDEATMREWFREVMDQRRRPE